MSRSASVGALCLGFAAVAGGCEFVAGIEDLDLSRDGGTMSGDSTVLDAPYDSSADVLPSSRDASGQDDSPADGSITESAVDTGRDSPATDTMPDRLDAGRDSSVADAMLVGDGAPHCIQDLSDIGQADFRILFTVSTTQQGSMVALLNQRSICGSGMYWDVRLYSGEVRFESQDNGQNPWVIFQSNPPHPVNDGVQHAVEIKRASGAVTIVVDGNTTASDTATASSFAQLPLLEEDTDPCAADGGCPAHCGDGTLPFVGTLANVCLSSP